MSTREIHERAMAYIRALPPEEQMKQALAVLEGLEGAILAAVRLRRLHDKNPDSAWDLLLGAWETLLPPLLETRTDLSQVSAMITLSEYFRAKGNLDELQRNLGNSEDLVRSGKAAIAALIAQGPEA